MQTNQHRWCEATLRVRKTTANDGLPRAPQPKRLNAEFATTLRQIASRMSLHPVVRAVPRMSRHGTKDGRFWHGRAAGLD